MRTDIINRLIREHGYVSYLEIGYQDGVNFHNINCKSKVAVDPYPNRNCIELLMQTSDDFFKTNLSVFDIVFIDGLHHADQVRKDIINASKWLSVKGCIVLHDLLPESKIAAQREVCSGAWNGDCWRAAVGLLNKYPNENFITHNTDHGVGVLFPNGETYHGNFEDMDMAWKYFNRDKNELLRVI